MGNLVENRKKVFMSNGKLALPYDKEQLLLIMDEIAFIKCYGNYCKIQLDTEDETNSYIVRTSVKNLEQVLNEDNFLRISRSYIINVDLIDEMSISSIKIKGENISVSRKIINSLLDKMMII